jgi:transcriptional regulator with XRE-family HTH domain
MKPETFAEWLVAQRELHEMTQGDVEDAASIDHAQYSRLENGKPKMPTARVRDRIHSVFKTSDSDLAEAGLLQPRVRLDGTVVYEPVRKPKHSPASSAGELATIAELVSRLPDDAVQHLRKFLEAVVAAK